MESLFIPFHSIPFDYVLVLILSLSILVIGQDQFDDFQNICYTASLVSSSLICKGIFAT